MRRHAAASWVRERMRAWVPAREVGLDRRSRRTAGGILASARPALHACSVGFSSSRSGAPPPKRAIPPWPARPKRASSANSASAGSATCGPPRRCLTRRWRASASSVRARSNGCPSAEQLERGLMVASAAHGDPGSRRSAPGSAAQWRRHGRSSSRPTARGLLDAQRSSTSPGARALRRGSDRRRRTIGSRTPKPSTRAAAEPASHRTSVTERQLEEPSTCGSGHGRSRLPCRRPSASRARMLRPIRRDPDEHPRRALPPAGRLPVREPPRAVSSRSYSRSVGHGRRPARTRGPQ